jgi:hypothetical protein
MATQTRTLATANGGAVSLALDFDNVSGANLHMIVGAPDKNNPDGISVPFNYTVTWSSA